MTSSPCSIGMGYRWDFASTETWRINFYGSREFASLYWLNPKPLKVQRWLHQDHDLDEPVVSFNHCCQRDI